MGPLRLIVCPWLDFFPALYHETVFDVGVTFEMREPNTEKSIFRLIMIVVSQHLLNGRVKGKVAERQRERGE
jgi:hypothetical protein